MGKEWLSQRVRTSPREGHYPLDLQYSNPSTAQPFQSFSLSDTASFQEFSFTDCCPGPPFGRHSGVARETAGSPAAYILVICLLIGETAACPAVESEPFRKQMSKNEAVLLDGLTLLIVVTPLPKKSPFFYVVGHTWSCLRASVRNLEQHFLEEMWYSCEHVKRLSMVSQKKISRLLLSPHLYSLFLLNNKITKHLLSKINLSTVLWLSFRNNIY